MTAPAPPAGPSPMRIGGIALLGLGVVAGLIGLAGLALDGGDGDDPSAAGPTTSVTGTVAPSAGAPPGGTPTAGPGAPGGSSGNDGAVPVPSFGPTPTRSVDGRGAPAPGSVGTGGVGSLPDGTGGGSAAGTGGGGGGGPTIVRGPVRVYNNSTISGLAARAAADFREQGWQVEEVGNYPFGIIPTTTVYYRPGTSEQPAAKVMSDGFGMRAEPRFEGLDEASPGLIVIVTNDYRAA